MSTHQPEKSVYYYRTKSIVCNILNITPEKLLIRKGFKSNLDHYKQLLKIDNEMVYDVMFAYNYCTTKGKIEEERYLYVSHKEDYYRIFKDSDEKEELANLESVFVSAYYMTLMGMAILEIINPITDESASKISKLLSRVSEVTRYNIDFDNIGRRRRTHLRKAEKKQDTKIDLEIK